MLWKGKATIDPNIDYSHKNDVIMSTMTSQMTNLTNVYSSVYLGADERKHDRSASLAFVRVLHRWLVNSAHEGPVMRKMVPFDDVIHHDVFGNNPLTGPMLNRCQFGPQEQTVIFSSIYTNFCLGKTFDRVVCEMSAILTKISSVNILNFLNNPRQVSTTHISNSNSVE